MATTTKPKSKKLPSYAGGVRDPVHYPTLVNKPGEMVMLPKHDLRVDPSYQRPVNPRAVHRISANWNWIACGVIIVSVRPNAGGYFIVDGQHRWEAVKQLGTIREIPCLAFEINDIKDEASGFLAANTERQIPLMVHKFRALVTIKDSAALIADELIRESGRIINRAPGKTHIRCIGDLMRVINEDAIATKRIWPIFVELSQDNNMSGILLKGLYYIERKMPKGFSLTDRRQRDRLKQVGLTAIMESIQQAASFEGNRGPKVCALGIMRAMNKGLRNPIKVNLD